MELTKAFYNTILSQVFSPCGNYFVVGDIYGTISVFHLSKLINAEVKLSPNDQLPKSSFSVGENVQVNSLASTSDFLIVGTIGEIQAYPWKNVKMGNTTSCAWNIEISNAKEGFDRSDINSLYLIEEKNVLLAGCGDNNIYFYDIETRKQIRVLSNHTGYIHSLSGLGNNLASGGEDGLVFIWDIREKRYVNNIEPHLDDQVVRPQLGKWIGAVGYSEDFLVCGGGPRLSLWHLRSLNNSNVFTIEDRGIHVAEIYQDKIFAGGRCQYFYEMSFNGDIVTEIPTSCITAYSVIHQEESLKALCIAGASKKIDVCTNFVYKDLILSVE